MLAIGQQSHAWISGQLARAWGNELFGAVDPYEEVCLAAEQHDIGMAEWDLSPTLDPETGLPYSFMEMPLQEHLALWSAGPRRLLAQSRYATLLVSMHGMRLYERRDLEKLGAEEADAVRSFLGDKRSFQEGLLESLRSDSMTTTAAAADVLARNSQLIWIWDFLSLAVCLDWSPCTAREVPNAGQPVDVEMVPGKGPGQLLLEPWPFAQPAVRVRCEGRRLHRRAESEEELDEVVGRAQWETVEFELAPDPGRSVPGSS